MIHNTLSLDTQSTIRVHVEPDMSTDRLLYLVNVMKYTYSAMCSNCGEKKACHHYNMIVNFVNVQSTTLVTEC